jgi:hypothetical protein
MANRISDEEFKASMEKAINAQKALTGQINQAVLTVMQRVMEEREQILHAFVAKYGFEPDECVQVEFRTKEGQHGWCVRKKEDVEP